MRLRVVGVLGCLLLLLLAIISAVLMQNASRDATQDLQLNRLASLNRFVQLAAESEKEANDSMLQLEMDTYSALFDEGLLVTLGERQLVSGNLDSDPAVISETVHNAQLSLSQTEIHPVNPFATGPAVIARPFGSSTQVLGTVLMEVNLQPARTLVLQRWALALVVGISVGAALLLMADRLSTWVVRPIHRLNNAVKELAITQTPAPLQEAGPPELRELARSFSNMAEVMSQSLNQQRELIAETSHQLRNPIAALRLRVDLLKLRLGRLAHPQNVDAVEKELLRVENLLDGVLRLASADHRLSEVAAGRSLAAVQKMQEPVSPSEVIAEEFERQSLTAELSNTPLSFESESSKSLLVACNAFELQQMIAEIIQNAMKYAPGAPVTASVLGGGDQIEIQIQDQGSGLSAEERTYATQRFWRSTQVQNSSGTGLGMAIVDRLARANGGTLKLDAAPGGGLAVRLFLPRYRAELHGSADGTSQ